MKGFSRSISLQARLAGLSLEKRVKVSVWIFQNLQENIISSPGMVLKLISEKQSMFFFSFKNLEFVCHTIQGV